MFHKICIERTEIKSNFLSNLYVFIIVYHKGFSVFKSFLSFIRALHSFLPFVALRNNCFFTMFLRLLILVLPFLFIKYVQLTSRYFSMFLSLSIYRVRVKFSMYFPSLSIYKFSALLF